MTLGVFEKKGERDTGENNKEPRGRTQPARGVGIGTLFQWQV